MAPAYTGNSIVDYLNSVGQGSSFSERARLASQMGINNYQGTAAQNMQLLNSMRNSGGQVQQNPFMANQPATARNFYRQGGSYYYTDTGERVSDVAELQQAARAGGREVPYEETQVAIDNRYKEAAANNPAIRGLIDSGNDLDTVINSLETGDISGMVDWNGQPFSAQDQQEALQKAQEDNRLYYEALQKKEQTDAEDSLARQQAEYQQQLANSQVNFEQDKANLDKNAAQSGVLFSGSRAQKQQNLANRYKQAQDYSQGALQRNISNTARDLEYKYGGDVANNLSRYYNAERNTYDPTVARGGVQKSSLSSLYTPGGYGFQGTRNTERMSTANVRAADYLKNKGNKLLQTGYQNKL